VTFHSYTKPHLCADNEMIRGILLAVPAKISVSVLVNALKGTSSRLLRKGRGDIARRYRDGVLWSPSYLAASTDIAASTVVKRYVEQQRASSSP
jgi:putative transposase